MSNKPEGIPEGIWNAAGCAVNMQGRAAKPDEIEPVARAIMAAVEAERERCALIAEGQSVSIAHPAASGTAAYITAAIRSRT